MSTATAILASAMLATPGAAIDPWIDLAASSVRAAVGDRFEQTEIALLSLGTLAHAAPDSAPHDARFDVGPLRAGRVSVHATYLDRSNRRVEGVLWFRVRGYGQAWTALRDVPPGTVLTRDHVARARVDLAAMDLTTADLVHEPEGLWAVKPLRHGVALSTAALREPPLVAARQPVSVVLSNKNIRLQVGGTARDPGWRIGDPVRVEIPGADALVPAVVTGKGTVHVDA